MYGLSIGQGLTLSPGVLLNIWSSVFVAIALLIGYDQCPRSVASGEDLNRLYKMYVGFFKSPITCNTHYSNNYTLDTWTLCRTRAAITFEIEGMSPLYPVHSAFFGICRNPIPQWYHTNKDLPSFISVAACYPACNSLQNGQY